MLSEEGERNGEDVFGVRRKMFLISLQANWRAVVTDRSAQVEESGCDGSIEEQETRSLC